MRLFKDLVDRLRTLFRVRNTRQLPPAHSKPALGGSIIKDRFRIRLRHPIDDELWVWLCDMGWRTMPIHNNRRKYVVVSEKAFDKLIKAEPSMRTAIHAQLIEGRSKRRS